MSDHTRGPLYTLAASSTKPDEEGDFAIYDKHRHIIGEAYRTVAPGQVRPAEANARLWAAAPELLAAAEHAVLVLASHSGSVSLVIGSREYEVIERLQAAIAKATGGQA